MARSLEFDLGFVVISEPDSDALTENLPNGVRVVGAVPDATYEYATPEGMRVVTGRLFELIGPTVELQLLAQRLDHQGVPGMSIGTPIQL